MNFSKTDLAISCAVYFDENHGIDPKTWANLAMSILAHAGFPPDLVHTTQYRLPFRIENFRKRGQHGEFYKSVHGDPTRLLEGWHACAIYFKDCVVFCFPACAVPTPKAISILKQIASTLPLGYGTIYKLPYQRMPEAYAVGIVGGLGWDERSRWEAERVGAWFLHQQDFLQGKLRDIYPVSALNAEQRRSAVGNVSLEHWIRGKTSRGSLSTFDSNLSLWEVPEDRIPTIRRELSHYGILIAYPPGIFHPTFSERFRKWAGRL